MSRLKTLLTGAALLVVAASCITPRATVILDDVEDSSMLVIDEHDAYVARTDGEGSWASIDEAEAEAMLSQSALFAELFADADGTGYVQVSVFEGFADPVFDRYVGWVSEEFPYDPAVDPIEPLDRRVRLRSVALVRDYIERVKGE